MSSGKLLLGGSETLHILRRKPREPYRHFQPQPQRRLLLTKDNQGLKTMDAGVQSHLLVAIEVSKLLHLKQVSLHGEERHLRVFQDRQRDGGQFQAVLLQTEDFETWTLGDLW